MEKTKFKNRKLPVYTPEEEMWNMLTHVVGATLCGLIGIMCVLKAVVYNKNILDITCSSVFLCSILCVYTISSIYHSLKKIQSKKVLQIIDHCMIYFLIAGTYTPFVLCALWEKNKTAAFFTIVFVWSFTILATVFTAINLEQYKVFSMICYLFIGWCIIFSIKDMYEILTPAGFWLLLGGGISYTVGAIFYGLACLKHIKFAHCIFHIFTLAGTLLQAFSILYYVL